MAAAKGECWETQWEIAKREMSGVTWLSKGFTGHFEYINIPIESDCFVSFWLFSLVVLMLSGFSFKSDELIF